MSYLDWVASLWPGGGRFRYRTGERFKLFANSLQDVVLKGYEPHEPEFAPPFEVVEPARLTCPLVFSSPHSGNVYPRRFLAAARLEEAVLRRSEDAFVDVLFGGVNALGAPLIKARFPRAYLDLNREPYELDPRMFEGTLPPFANTRSLRVAGGLGTIPRVAAQVQEIYVRRMPVEEAMLRIEKLYKPYHACLAKLIERARRVFGIAVLVDCHSMPSAIRRADHTPLFGDLNPPGKPDVVIGDRFGKSCGTDLVDALEGELRRGGYIVQRNKPYAGGYITEHYGNPANDCHAMQIEVSRALYMDECGVRRSERFAAVAEGVTKAAAVLVEAVAARHGRLRAAAE
ncbi:MAG TPA: N-formylglutamate amidohydrolase [Methylocella sp.]|nr:N-formylglutamate amidohydrolase [Methylocella sp.]